VAHSLSVSVSYKRFSFILLSPLVVARSRRAICGRATIARSRCRTRLSSIEAIIPRYQRVCLYAPTAASTYPFP
jgi:hypothetical protein